jgi:hypothetical protein
MLGAVESPRTPDLDASQRAREVYEALYPDVRVSNDMKRMIFSLLEDKKLAHALRTQRLKRLKKYSIKTST